MMIFVDLGDQIVPGMREFAYYITSDDHFVTLAGNQTWRDMLGLRNDWTEHQKSPEAKDSGYSLKEFENIMQEWVPEEWDDSEMIA